MVTDVTVSGQIAQQNQAAQQTVGLAEDFSQFLQLLTTQLQNQDPLSPLDSNQFTEQLVQFSQVEQAINTNSRLDDLVALQIGNSASTALGYVGLDASYISPEVIYDGENPANVRYSLDSPAETATINIFDETNQLIFSGDADRTVGVHDFEWNGRDLAGNPLAEGTYLVRVDALDANDEVIETTTVVTSRVRGIEQQDGIVFALVGDRAVPVGSILNATVPETETTSDNGGVDGSTS